ALEMSRQDRESTIVNRDSLEADVPAPKRRLSWRRSALEMSRQDRESTIVNRDSLEADVPAPKRRLSW
ncbi:hypothetical protein CKF46_37880, partial [Klebsiella pneumoniae]